MKKHTLAILGAGSWGTAVAIHCARAHHNVLLWARDDQHVKDMQEQRENKRYLPGIALPPTLLPTENLTRCLKEAEHIMIAVPSHAFKTLIDAIDKNMPLSGLSWLTKGVDPKTHVFFSDIVAKRFGQDFPMAMISGPSFANEVAREIPTALIFAGNQIPYLLKLRDLIDSKTLRAYFSQDLIGVQLCGAVKNIVAIACGISDGLKYGANTKAALITRGLAEMTRLGLALGAHQTTFLGLAGVGDLVLTCTDNQSRNRRFGLLLGEGRTPSEAKNQIGQVVEGQHNAAQICDIAKQFNIEMPICNEVNAVLHGTITPYEASKNLMERPLKDE
ncbi:MAG: NAD(P)H-dependent glycerol-3-phosphate dehydrogenase [Legionellaceae bacterium]